MKPTPGKLSRRTFLLAAGAGGAAATAAIVANKSPGPAQKQKSIPQSKGYQLTEHVQNYYRTTKV
jgi:TAT (twin-arginine translocation) pathway signal sequence